MPTPAYRPPDKRAFWEDPWGYPEAVAIALGLTIVGLVLQALWPALYLQLPDAPMNWVTLCVPLVVVGLAFRLAPDNPVLRGLGGIPMAIVATTVLAILSVPAAIWPQGPRAPMWQQRLGLSHVFSSLPFAAAMTLVLLNLGIVTAKRLTPLRRGTATFLLTHGGLLVALAGMLASTAQFQRTRVTLIDGGDFTNEARDEKQVVRLPFSLRLLKFRVEYFPPTLAFGSHSDRHWRFGHKVLKPGVDEKLGPYTIRVEQVIEQAVVMDGRPVQVPHEGMGPAVQVSIYDARGVRVEGGWLHPPRELGHGPWLEVPEGVISLRSPQPKVYESTIEVRASHSGQSEKQLVRVNEPLSVAGWKLYQHSYGNDAHTLEPYSVLEAIRDPGLGVTYAGLYMLMAGCLVHLWNAARRLGEKGGRP